jgi:molybdopterin-guanine dinucleotide biosynthesis protein A
MPFSDPLAAQRIIELTGERDIGALTDGNGRFEPLFAYYKKSILPIVERAIASGDYKLKTIFDKVSVKTVIREELGGLYSDRLLLNVNYPEDYEKLVRERSPD